jgi:catechol 2,3-dioxygenase-like lactoylglutathione lyase family enzyme
MNTGEFSSSVPAPDSSSLAVSFRSNRDIAIHVPDLAVAEEFYGKVLGFNLLGRSDEYLVFDTGSFRLYASCGALCSFVPSFDVPDLDSARRCLEAAGCTEVDGAPTYFKDPFGFVFDIIQRR